VPEQNREPPFNQPELDCLATRLDDGKLGGGDVKGIDIWGKAGKGLLGSIWADQGVDLDGVDVVELLESLLDLTLVGLDVDDEDEGVVLLDLLHGALGVERVDDDLVLIEARSVWDALAWVLWRAGQDQGLWAVEGRGEADLAGLLGVNLKQMLAKSVEHWRQKYIHP
jgi:hypothetical protein